MELETYNCRKCGLTISSTCSKCHRVVDVKKLDDGCIVQVTKCRECANMLLKIFVLHRTSNFR